MHILNFILFSLILRVTLSIKTKSVLEVSHKTKSGMKLGCKSVDGSIKELFFETHDTRKIVHPSSLTDGLHKLFPEECLIDAQSRNVSKLKQSPSLGSNLGMGCTPGQPGLDGRPGMQGPRGPVGNPGKNGMNGRNGRNGLDGRPGERGIIGLRGLPGNKGVKGIQGSVGFTGLPGLPGRDGRDGLPGIPAVNPDRVPSPHDVTHCDQFFLKDLKRSTITADNDINIFICNSANVDVNVDLNSNIENGYQLLRKTHEKDTLQMSNATEEEEEN